MSGIRYSYSVPEASVPTTESGGSGQSPSNLGILLGAGGIRGCAHAGVFSVMREAGVEAGVVVGSSIGALFGAAYAAGWEVERIRFLADRAPRWATGEFYLNRLRIDRSTYIGRTLMELGEETLIEELPRRFACMALDCRTGTIVCLDSGRLLPALQASIALPGIARPVTIGDTSYLDGGLRGPIAASTARMLGADRIIRVELVGAHALRNRFRQQYSGLVASLRPEEVSSPRLASSTSSFVGGDDADVTITPGFYGLFCNAPVGIRFCVARGEAAARVRLADLKALMME